MYPADPNDRYSLIVGLVFVTLLALWLAPVLFSAVPLDAMRRFNLQPIGHRWPPPTPTETPAQQALYEECPELRFDSNAICVSNMLHTASELFSALWAPFAIICLLGVVVFIFNELAKGYLK